MAVKAVTIGFFDGVHIGHRRVLNTLLGKGGETRVLTFWPHPRAVLQQGARGLCLLNTLEEKMAVMRSLGVKNIECLDFTREFASMTARQFVSEYLIGKLSCTALVLGYDNRIGSDGLDTQQVKELCEASGLEVSIVPPCLVDGVTVSSTQIRAALASGDVVLASRMLGAEYSVSGLVIPGNQLGRTLGFPTANIGVSFPLKAIPADGVYATRVSVGGRVYGGMTNIGVRPTVSDSPQRVIETNIFDFDEDIYGLDISISFVQRIRGEIRFSSLEELTEQLREDKKQCALLF